MFWSKKPAPRPPQSPPLPATPPPLPATPPPLPKEPMRLGKGNPGVFDGPKNSLEEALVAYRERRIEVPQFLEVLFNSEVFVLPLAKDLVGAGDGAISLSKLPTLFCMNYPEYSALGLYTAQERAKPTYDLHPEFRFAVRVQAGDFLFGLRSRFGIVINPYWDVNMEWNDRQVTHILALMKRE